jgi:putative ABC transport system permease protein
VALILEKEWLQHQTMFKNYFKTALRNLLRQRSSAVLNIAGLAIGITCSIILFLLIRHQLSFDTFHSKYESIYRVVSESEGNDGKGYSPGIPPVLAPAFKNDFPEAEAVAFTTYRSGATVMVPQKTGEPQKFYEEAGVVFTEPTFFKIFDRPAIIGDAEKSIDEPNEAVISRKLALKYFKREDVVGEVVEFEDRQYKIGAVINDHGANTDMPFDLLLSYETIRKKTEENGWGSIWSDEHCYFLLKDDASIDQLNARMPAFSNKYVGEKNYNKQAFTIQPLSEVHYDDRYGAYSYNTVTIGNILVMTVVGIFLLLTACINFINLTTAEAIKRSKEVGVRKTLGGSRSQLIFQFLGETSFITLTSIVVSLCLAQVALGFLNPFLEMELAIHLSSDTALLIYLVTVFIGVSLLSGLYPSLVMSGYKPAIAMKSQSTTKNSTGYLFRKALVVFQFTISQVLIIGTIVLIAQMRFTERTELGFRKDAVINIPIPEDENPAYMDTTGQGSTMRTLVNEVSRIAGVEKVSLNSATPSSGNTNNTGFVLEGESDDKRKNTQVKHVDGNYINLFELPLIAGQGLPDLDTATGFVVNEKFVQVSGVTTPQDMVGKIVRIWGRRLPVLGVVKNFHATSLRDGIEPLVMFNRVRSYSTMSVRVDARSYKASVDQIQKLWEASYPKHIFDYSFLDQEIKEFYQTEQRWSVLVTIFTSLAIFIGCLGLFGLVTFMANQKTKEIGIRKVMGASVESIVLMFTKEFSLLIVLGFVFAAPLSYWVMSMFLSNYAYHIDLGVWIFLGGIGSTLVIAVLTVGYRSFRAAAANPIKSLRYE